MLINTNEEEILKSIDSPDDIKKLSTKELYKLAEEIRQFLIKKISKTGGHIASNLGVVELTLAIHSIFDSPKDKIVWDVGHQTYVQKIITGRKDKFDTLRKYNGISGFPKVNESIHDCFNTGHSSTSISAAFGIAKARDLKKENSSVVAIIGDGALTGGMAFEALNDAGRSPSNLIVILNDNEMSISKNVGGLSKYLGKLRSGPYYKVKEDIDVILDKIPGIGKTAKKALHKVKGTIKYVIMPGLFFEELGFKYYGPIDGHNIDEIKSVLHNAKQLKGPVLIHVCTQKGKGYVFAEKKPHLFHGISPFHVETGELKSNSKIGYSQVFGEKMLELAEIDDKLVAITAAMPHGTGLDKFLSRYPDRCFDVGIAEQHAVTFAAGLASNGIKPVVAIYSSFLQRAYDQIFHDVALQELNVVFAIDRAGIVGDDGETHQGIYDISFLSSIPNMTIMAPCDYIEFRGMLDYVTKNSIGPAAIRYQRGKGKEKLIDYEPVALGKGVKARNGKDISIIAIGNMVETALEVSENLEKMGIETDVINARFVKPLDKKLLLESINKTRKVITIEDNVLKGGFGSNVMQLITENGIDATSKNIAYPDEPISHGAKNIILAKYGMDAKSITEEAIKMFNKFRG